MRGVWIGSICTENPRLKRVQLSLSRVGVVHERVGSDHYHSFGSDIDFHNHPKVIFDINTAPIVRSSLLDGIVFTKLTEKKFIEGK